MIAEFDVRDTGWFDPESEGNTKRLSVNLTDKEVAELQALTPETVIAYLRNQCVGHCNTISGTDEYFIPRLKFGSLEASLQVNYYVWSLRDDRRSNHEALITAEEFDAVCSGPRSVLDVMFVLDGRRISMGQMTVGDVAEFLHELVGDHYIPELLDRP